MVSLTIHPTNAQNISTEGLFLGAEILKYQGNDLRPPMPVSFVEEARRYQVNLKDNDYRVFIRAISSAQSNIRIYAHFTYARK